MKPDRLLNRRVVFKLHGMDPLDATILNRMKPATGFAAERWQVNWTKPIVLFRRAMCATLSSAASSGSALQGNGSED